MGNQQRRRHYKGARATPTKIYEKSYLDNVSHYIQDLLPIHALQQSVVTNLAYIDSVRTGYSGAQHTGSQYGYGNGAYPQPLTAPPPHNAMPSLPTQRHSSLPADVHAGTMGRPPHEQSLYGQGGPYAGVAHLRQNTDELTSLANKVRWVRFERGGADHRLHMLLCTHENVHVWDVQDTDEVCEVAVIECKRAKVCKLLQDATKHERAPKGNTQWDVDQYHDRLLLAVVSSTFREEHPSELEAGTDRGTSTETNNPAHITTPTHTNDNLHTHTHSRVETHHTAARFNTPPGDERPPRPTHNPPSNSGAPHAHDTQHHAETDDAWERSLVIVSVRLGVETEIRRAGDGPVAMATADGDGAHADKQEADVTEVKVVKRLPFDSNVTEVQCNSRFVVVALADSIHVLQAGTLQGLFRISGCRTVDGRVPIALGTRWIAYAVPHPKGTPLSSRRKQSSPGTRTGRSDQYSDVNGTQGATTAVEQAKDVAKDFATGLKFIGNVGYSTVTSVLGSATQRLDGANAYSYPVSNNNTHPTTETASVQEDETNPVGAVVVRDLTNRSMVATFPAHRTHSVRYLTFNPTGTLLVTASTQGQTINVFMISQGLGGRQQSSGTRKGLSAAPSTPQFTARHIYKLARGHTNAVIQDISFSPDSRWVSVSSTHGTTHLFGIHPLGGSVSVRTHTSVAVPNNLKVYSSAGADALSSKQVEVLSPLSRIRQQQFSEQIGNYDTLPVSCVFMHSHIQPTPPAISTNLFITNHLGAMTQYSLTPHGPPPPEANKNSIGGITETVVGLATNTNPVDMDRLELTAHPICEWQMLLPTNAETANTLHKNSDRDEYAVLGYDGDAPVGNSEQLTGNDVTGGESWNLSEMIDEDDGIYYSEGVEVNTGVKPSDKHRQHNRKTEDSTDAHSVDSGISPSPNAGGPMESQGNNDSRPIRNERIGMGGVKAAVEPRRKMAEWLPCVEIQTHFAQRPLWTGAQFSLKTLQRPDANATPYEGSLPELRPVATDASVLLDDDMQEMNVDTSGHDPRPVPEWTHTGNAYDEKEASVVITSKAQAHDTVMESVDMDSLMSALEEPMSTDDLILEQPYVPDRDEGIVRTMFDDNRVVQTIGPEGMPHDAATDAEGESLGYGDDEEHDIIMQSMDVDVDTSYYKADEPLPVRSRSTDTESEEEEPMLQPPVGITAHDVIINHVYDETKGVPDVSQTDAASQIDGSGAGTDRRVPGDGVGQDNSKSQIQSLSQKQSTEGHTEAEPINDKPPAPGTENSSTENPGQEPDSKAFSKSEEKTTKSTPKVVVNRIPDADLSSSSTSASSGDSTKNISATEVLTKAADVAQPNKPAEKDDTSGDARTDSDISHAESPDLSSDLSEVSPEVSKTSKKVSEVSAEVSEGTVTVEDNRLTEAEIVALFSNTALASASSKENASRADSHLSVDAETDGGSSTSFSSKKKKKKKKKKPSRSNSRSRTGAGVLPSL